MNTRSGAAWTDQFESDLTVSNCDQPHNCQERLGLPPLPEHTGMIDDRWYGYTADQMQDHARAAVLADRQQRGTVSTKVEDERAAFEERVSGRTVVKKYGAKLTTRKDGSYGDYRINDRWLAWQARAALDAQRSGAKDSIREALEESTALLVAMLHETRHPGEISARIVDNRAALQQQIQESGDE